ncbi:efflux RND transporter periplasmic adaptor subunit [Phytohalomonas tamaricis]|uniref:efflux RND transporter periplasmic adaptor subunit n=1 Tax=Phytohalomonas tamaricis TaxID=2081032 RepID=UPI000D0B441E|nr:efflux RND transporter periplasmic adaptor subunit [Phytohalomonas tamaricis]
MTDASNTNTAPDRKKQTPRHDVKRPLAWLVALVLIALAALLYWGLPQVTTPQSTTTRPPTTVGAADVIARELGRHFESVGDVKAEESVDLAALVTERVARIAFSEGQRVKRGELLIQLDDRTERYELQAARVALDEAEREYARLKTLSERGALSRQQFDAQRTLLETAKVDVARLQEALNDRAIEAPFDGVVGLRRLSVGSLVSPGEVLATLDKLDSIKVDFTLPERYLTSLTVGAPVTAASVAYPDRRFRGRIATLDTRLAAETRSVVARARFDNPDGLLYPGMLLTLDFSTPAERRLIVPETALQSENDRHYVYRIDRNEEGLTAQRIAVNVVQREPGWVALQAIEGAELDTSDRVVVSGQQKLSDAARIQINEEGSRDTQALFEEDDTLGSRAPDTQSTMTLDAATS